MGLERITPKYVNFRIMCDVPSIYYYYYYYYCIFPVYVVVLDGNFAVGCGPGKDYPKIRKFQCMLERTDAITNEVLEPITFVLAYPT